MRAPRPRRAALESLTLLALAAPVAARLTGGTGAAILAFLGAVTGFSTKAFLPAGRALILYAGTAVLVAAATAAYGRAGWVGLIVAAAAVLGGAANYQSSGVLSIASAMAAIAFPGARSEAALEPVLALRYHPGPGIGADRVKGSAQVPGGLSGQLLPADGSVVAGEPQVVLAR